MHFRDLLSATALIAALVAPAAAGAETVVPLPPFKQIELHGGGSILLRHGPVQRVTLRKGSTAFTSISVGAPQGRFFKHGARAQSDRLVIKACNGRCPPRYDLEIEIVTPEISAISVNGGGEIVAARGFPREDSVAAAVNGGGEIDIRAMPVRDIAAAVHGGGRLLVRAQNSLVAAVHGGGEIRFWGRPSLTAATRGGGSISSGE
jgi:hypothetical protein